MTTDLSIVLTNLAVIAITFILMDIGKRVETLEARLHHLTKYVEDKI